jgi:hypothetical protein
MDNFYNLKGGSARKSMATMDLNDTRCLKWILAMVPVHVSFKKRGSPSDT